MRVNFTSDEPLGKSRSAAPGDTDVCDESIAESIGTPIVRSPASNRELPVYDEALLYRLELMRTGANVHLINNLMHAYASSFHLLTIQLNREEVQGERGGRLHQAHV